MLGPVTFPDLERLAPEQQVTRLVQMLLNGGTENIVLVRRRPSAIFETAARIFVSPTGTLYDAIHGNMFKHNDFSHGVIIEKVLDGLIAPISI
jgi:hypothetical protein